MKPLKPTLLAVFAFAILTPDHFAQNGERQNRQGSGGGGRGQPQQEMTREEWLAQKQKQLEARIMAFMERMVEDLTDEQADQISAVVTHHFVQKFKNQLTLQAGINKEQQKFRESGQQPNREKMREMRMKHASARAKADEKVKKETESAAKDILDKKQMKKFRKTLAELDPAPRGPGGRGPGGGGFRGGGGRASS
ncbi:MAG: hypothetical protein AAGB46_14230 [Verrucomicrobiota bacterium]